MARKGENIFKRKDGRWEARYVKSHEFSGKIRYGFCYGKTYKEAKEKAEQCKADLRNNMWQPPTVCRRRFSSLCEEWLQLERGKVKESTYVKYDTIVAKHILPRLGDFFPPEISTQIAGQFRQDLLDAELSAKTVRDILMVLHTILKYASAQYPGLMPAVEISYPRQSKKEPRILTLEEQKRFISYLQTDMDECKFGVFLAFFTGLRIGELCALRWENVSLKDGTVHISATMQRIKDLSHVGQRKTKIVISSPKSDASVRTIPLTDCAARVCRQYDPHDSAAFLLTGTDHFMEPRQMQKRLGKYTKECGLEGVHFHTIRHTFATRCVEAGFEIKTLSEILGHASASVTLGCYVHSSMEMKRANMDKLASLGL